MAKSVEYPSAKFPGPPRITIEVPDDWETLTVPGVQVAVAEPRVEGQFRANVVVTVQRFGADFTLEAARAGLDQRKAALPELEELGTGEIEVEGTTWIASEYGYTQPGRPTVVQAARYAGTAAPPRTSSGRRQPRHESADDQIETVPPSRTP